MNKRDCMNYETEEVIDLILNIEPLYTKMMRRVNHSDVIQEAKVLAKRYDPEFDLRRVRGRSIMQYFKELRDETTQH